MSKQTTIRLPEELLESAKEKAQKEDLSFSQVVRKLLREWLASQEANKIKTR